MAKPHRFDSDWAAASGSNSTAKLISGAALLAYHELDDAPDLTQAAAG